MKSTVEKETNMNIIVKIAAVLVALEFFYILYLETFATSSEKTSKVFGMSREELKRDSVHTLFKNQGVYNGLLAVLILLAVFVFGSIPALRILMGYIILVAAYGSITSSPKIILMQGGLPIITLILSFLL
jgi:putative membrane protein